MRIFGRRTPPLPPDSAKALGITASDTVLAWAALVGGGVAAATVDRLLVLTPFGKRITRPWVDVDHASWDGDSRTVAVWWVGTRQTTPLELQDGEQLAIVIRERVQSSVLLSTEVGVPGGTVRIALRRNASGGVSTQAVPARGVRLDDPAVAAVVQRALRHLLEEAGL